MALVRYHAGLIFLMSSMYWSPQLSAKEIKTNAVVMADAPQWLRRTRVDKVTDRIQRHMEWTIRRINVHWHMNQKDFEKTHNLGPNVTAVSLSKTQEIHIGPKVSDKNFDQIFGHELVHIISFQKYKDAIPKWLEEGLANHLAKKEKVDYKWLIGKPFPDDVRKMIHPTRGSYDEALYRYKASQALIEMLDKKCDLENLLRLSVERNMDDYIATYCEIKDLNASFKDWVQSQVKAKKSKKSS